MDKDGEILFIIGNMLNIKYKPNTNHSLNSTQKNIKV